MSTTDMQGQTLGSLVVLSRSGTNSDRQATWLVDCDCGNRLVVSGNALRRGKTDCGSCDSRKQPEMDWEVPFLEGMDSRIQAAVRDVARRYADAVDSDELTQEANLLLASNGPRVRAYLADPEQGWSYVSAWLWRKLQHVAQSEVTIQSRQIDYDLLRDE